MAFYSCKDFVLSKCSLAVASQNIHLWEVGVGGGSGEGEGCFNARSLGLFSALVDLCQFFYLDAKETRDFAKRRDKLSFLGFLTLS